MDFVKNAMGNNQGQQGVQGTGAAAPQAQGGAVQQEDYVDKAFAMGVKDSGHSMNRNTQEKITDAGRNMYEKVTGKQVNSKISN